MAWAKGRRGYAWNRFRRRWVVYEQTPEGQRDRGGYETEREAWEHAVRIGACTVSGDFEAVKIGLEPAKTKRVDKAWAGLDGLGDPVVWFHAKGEQHARRTPELDLLRAVLESAIAELEHPKASIRRRAAQWFLDDDDQGRRRMGLAFVCAALHLDPSCVRNAALSARRAA